MISLKKKYGTVIEYFSANMPHPETELSFGSTYELIVAVILSAQCTDKRVNIITPSFFEKFPDPFSLAKALPEEIFNIIKSCSYPNNKAKNLSEMAKMLCEKFGGIVPSDPDDLLMLPGVGRKTANVVASVAFNKPVMAVDTHVFRVSARLGLTKNAKNPIEAERQLTLNIPAGIIHKSHHWLLLHGRYVCKARMPECENCGLSYICTYYRKKKKI